MKSRRKRAIQIANKYMSQYCVCMYKECAERIYVGEVYCVIHDAEITRIMHNDYLKSTKEG